MCLSIVPVLVLGTFAVQFPGSAQVLLQPSDSTNYGHDFFVASPPTTFQNIFEFQQEIIIGTYSASATYLANDTKGFTISSGQVGTIYPVSIISKDVDALVNQVMSSGFLDREKGVHIKATGENPVSVLFTMGDTDFFGSYLAYPCLDFQETSYEYYAVSLYSSTFNSMFVLVACDDDTEVTITPTQDVLLPDNAQNSSSELKNVTAGSTSFPLTLKQTQTLGVFATAADLSGSKVISNKPLTVVSGYQCGVMPFGNKFCEQLFVQIPPTVTWGTEFLLAPFATRKSGQYYRIVSREGNTNITYKQSGFTNITEGVITKVGGTMDFSTASGTYYYLRSSKPVFVVQFATGEDINSGGDGLGGPAISIVSPTHTYINSTSFTTLSEALFTQTAISITVAAEDHPFDSILFNGVPLNCSWTAIDSISGNIAGYGCTLTAIAANYTHSLEHTSGGQLSAMVYGFDSNSGYAYLTGMNLQNIKVKALFQLRSGPFASCLSWNSDTELTIQELILAAVVSAIKERCQCDFKKDLISGAVLLCDQQDSSQVTYRATITSYGSYSVQQLLTFLEDWVSQNATTLLETSVIVFDPKCTVQIDSVTDPVCSGKVYESIIQAFTASVTNHNPSSTQFLTPTVTVGNRAVMSVASAVGIGTGIILAVVAVSVVVIMLLAFFLLKKHRREHKGHSGIVTKTQAMKLDKEIVMSDCAAYGMAISSKPTNVLASPLYDEIPSITQNIAVPHLEQDSHYYVNDIRCDHAK